jgi:hypothetical protein
MSRCVEVLNAWDESMINVYDSLGVTRYIDSFHKHEVSFESSAVPGVFLTLDILMPHYTDRS